VARLGALLGLVRWPGAVTAAGNAATGFLLAHGPRSPGGHAAAVGAVLAGVLVYAGGVVLNDVADAERDRTLHPERPIPSGRADRRSSARFGAALLALGVLAASLLANPWAGAAAALAAVFAVLYDFTGRGLRIAGAALLGLARATNALAGAVAAGGGIASLTDPAAFPAAPHLHAGALLVYTALLTWTSTLEERRPGPTAIAFLALALALAAALPWSIFPRGPWPEAPGIAFLVLGGSFAVAAREAREPDGPGIGALVRAGVFGFLLVDAAWLFGRGRYEAGFWGLLVYVALRFALLRARS
jgi:4-hydroxybenzoate polyprenyltransferase